MEPKKENTATAIGTFWCFDPIEKNKATSIKMNEEESKKEFIEFVVEESLRMGIVTGH